MKERQNSTRWLGLALACGIITFAASTQAAKPPKPPPPSTSPAYVAVLLGGLRSADGTIDAYASDLNNAGQVVGRTAIPGYDSGYYSQAFLINPRDVNKDAKPEWFADALDNATGAPSSDGQNDLVIPLGTLPTPEGNTRHGSANAVNDLGLVVGISSDYNFATKVGSQKAFIVVPKDIDGGRCWYEDVNPKDGFNDLMAALGRPEGVPDSFYAVELDINNVGQVTGWFSDPNSASRFAFLLTPEDSNGDGKPDLWYREGSASGVNTLMVSLGTFLPASINNAGQIVGITDVRSAVLRSPDGSIIDLKPGGTVSEAKAINNRGQIGVWWQVDGVGHAGLLTPLDTDNDGTGDIWCSDANGDGVNDLVVDLGNLKGLENSFLRPQTLNDIGSVAGGSWHAGRDGLGWNRAAFLWENGMLQSLKSLTGDPLDLPDAYAINNARQILSEIAGGRDNPGLHACILLPTR